MRNIHLTANLGWALLSVVSFSILPLMTVEAASWEQSSEREMRALRSGDLAAVKQHINYKLNDVDIVNAALPAALKSGNVELIKYLKTLGWLDVCRTAKQQLQKYGAVCYPIHIAVGDGATVSEPLISFLIAEGFDPMAEDSGSYQRTAFHTAANYGKLQAVKFFCEQRLDNLRKSGYRIEEAYTVLEVAASVREERVVDYLLGRDCRAGTRTSGPSFPTLTPARSATVNPAKRIKEFTSPASFYLRYPICARLIDSTIQCWRGEDVPTVFQTSLPDADPTGKTRAIQYAPGGNHSCILLDSGAVKCWGNNDLGQLGLGNTMRRDGRTAEQIQQLPIVDLDPKVKVQQIASGGNFSCALLENGKVKCWGGNHTGDLGLGDTRNRGDKPAQMGVNLPVLDVGPEAKVTQIVASSHVCVLLENGMVKCWGNNRFGQLGLGDTRSRGGKPGDMGAMLRPVDLGPSAKVVQLAAGSSHTCGLLDSGSIKCWGANHVGQLGVGDARSRGDEPNEMGDKLPTVNLGSGVKALRIVADHDWDATCALLDNGGVKCWGYNGRGYFPSDMGDDLPYVKFQ